MKVYTPADMSDDICMGLSTNIYMDMRCRQGHECLPLHGYDMEISSMHASTSTRNIDVNLYMNIYISLDKDGDFS
jgi:hypothetical protein